MYYLDNKIKTLNRIFDQNERKDYLRLDLNENPGGLPQSFIDKVLSDVDSRLVAEYPETLHFTEVIADYLKTVSDVDDVDLENMYNHYIAKWNADIYEESDYCCFKKNLFH